MINYGNRAPDRISFLHFRILIAETIEATQYETAEVL